MSTRFLLPVSLAVLSGCAPGAEPSTRSSAAAEAADSIVSSWVATGRIPGAVLRIEHGDDLVLERAYGHALRYAPDGGQVEAPVAMRPGTAFDLASVTKVMATTLAVMMLVDHGAVRLDDPVEEHLPDFRGGGRESITLRHLLTHRSGLPQWHPVYYHAESADEAYAFLRTVPLRWPVGSERHYSDLGFMVLGRLVEAVTGTPLDRWLRDELYRPLGVAAEFRPRGDGAIPVDAIAATSHGNPFERRMVHDSTFGYRIEVEADAWDGWRTHTLRGEVNDGNAHHAFGGVAGHAGLFATAEDLATLLRLVMDGGRSGDRHVFSPSVADTFTTVTEAPQALGWQQPAFLPEGSFGHTGFTGTFVAAVPTLDLRVVLLTNRQHAGVGPDTRYPDLAALQEAVATAAMRGVAGPGPPP